MALTFLIISVAGLLWSSPLFCLEIRRTSSHFLAEGVVFVSKQSWKYLWSSTTSCFDHLWCARFPTSTAAVLGVGVACSGKSSVSGTASLVTVDVEVGRSLFSGKRISEMIIQLLTEF